MDFLVVIGKMGKYYFHHREGIYTVIDNLFLDHELVLSAAHH